MSEDPPDDIRNTEIQKIFSAMTEQEWRDLWNCLCLFAFKHYGWLQKVVRELDLEVVVLDAIEAAVCGDRSWPINKVALRTFLLNIIRSKISHIMEKEKGKLYISASPENSEGESLAPFVKCLSHSPDIEMQIAYGEMGDMLLKEVSDDPILTKLARHRIDDPNITPKQIMEREEWTEEKVRNGLRRLNRKAEALREVWENVK